MNKKTWNKSLKQTIVAVMLGLSLLATGTIATVSNPVSVHAETQTVYNINGADYDTTLATSTTTCQGIDLFYFDDGMLIANGMQTADAGEVAGMDEALSAAGLLNSVNTIYADYNANSYSQHMMFAGLSTVTKIRFGDNFSTSGVTDMCGMFSQCAVTSLDLSSFDTSSVTDMGSMFANCTATSINLSSFDTSNVTNMMSMFSGAAVTNLDLGHFNMANVTDISNMFGYCESLTSLNVSNWNLSSVTNIQNIFTYCNSLQELNGSGWNNLSVSDLSYLFYNLPSLTSLNVSGWSNITATDMSYMFHYCPADPVGIENWNTNTVTNMKGMFYTSGVTSLDLNDWDVSNVTDMSYMFSNCTALENIDISSWDTANVTDMSWMFSQCYNLASVDAFSLNMQSVSRMDFMFYEAGSYVYYPNTVIYDLQQWRFDTNTNLNSMFNSAKIDRLRVTDWSFNQPVNMSYFVYNTHINLDTSTWNSCKASDLSYAFSFWTPSDCNLINVSGINTSECTNFESAFENASFGFSIYNVLPAMTREKYNNTYGGNPYYALSQFGFPGSLDLNDWTFDSATSLRRMFCNASYQTIAFNPSIDTSHITDFESMFAINDMSNGIGGGQASEYMVLDMFEISSGANTTNMMPTTHKLYMPTGTGTVAFPQNMYELIGTTMSENAYTSYNLSNTAGTMLVSDTHFVDVYEGNDATCLSDGTKTYECQFCGRVKTVTETALGHDYETTTIGPTCLTEGYDEHKCTRCQDTYTDNETVALGHDWGDYVSDNNVTCLTDGTKTRTCKRDASHTETIDEIGSALGHNHITTTIGPTCTENGYDEHKCSRCQDTYTDNEVGALGHLPGETVVENRVEPTTAAQGWYENVIYCDRCNAELSREKVFLDKLPSNDPKDDDPDVPETEPEHEHASSYTEERNKVLPTCVFKGSYVEVTFCECGLELKSELKIIDALGHEPGEYVIENMVEAQVGIEGSYDEVVYCIREHDHDLCDVELSRETIIVPALEAEVDDTEESDTEATDTEIMGPIVPTDESDNGDIAKVIAAVTVAVIGSGSAALFFILYWRRRRISGLVVGNLVDGLRVTLTGKDNLETYTKDNGSFMFRNLKEDIFTLTVYGYADEVVFSTDIYTNAKEDEDMFIVHVKDVKRYELTHKGKRIDVTVNM